MILRIKGISNIRYQNIDEVTIVYLLLSCLFAHRVVFRKTRKELLKLIARFLRPEDIGAILCGDSRVEGLSNTILRENIRDRMVNLRRRKTLRVMVDQILSTKKEDE